MEWVPLRTVRMVVPVPQVMNVTVHSRQEFIASALQLRDYALPR